MVQKYLQSPPLHQQKLLQNLFRSIPAPLHSRWKKVNWISRLLLETLRCYWGLCSRVEFNRNSLLRSNQHWHVQYGPALYQRLSIRSISLENPTAFFHSASGLLEQGHFEYAGDWQGNSSGLLRFLGNANANNGDRNRGGIDADRDIYVIEKDTIGLEFDRVWVVCERVAGWDQEGVGGGMDDKREEVSDGRELKRGGGGLTNDEKRRDLC